MKQLMHLKVFFYKFYIVVLFLAQKSCLKRSGYRCSNNLKNQGMAFEQKKVGYTMEPTALNYYEIEEGNTVSIN